MENVMNNTEPISCSPSASRLVEGMRDTGYTFISAVADITDNSVSADASVISISLEETRRNQLLFMLADNGTGMTNEELINAMRYGSDERPEAASLGKFGLGLKTASTAFCKKLTVISRKNGQINAKQLDLDDIKKTNKILLYTPSLSDYQDQIDYLDDVSGGDRGTIIIWENIDRLIKTETASSRKTHLKRKIKDLEEHLSGVFYNFLEKDNNYPDVTINVNTKALQPWDPFCRWLQQNGNTERLDIHPQNSITPLNEQNQQLGEIKVNVYILPNKSEMSDEELARARYSLDNQGFHIFREGRMIYSGGWPNNILVKDQHLNLMRVELNFDHRLDDYFRIDIKKSNVDFPDDLKDTLKKMLVPARREAEKRYRRDGQKGKNNGAVSHDKSNNVLKRHHDESTAGSNVISADPATGIADIQNKFGSAKVRLLIEEDSSRLIITKDSLEDGVLWSFGLVNGNKHAVFLNENHDFYKKFYHANKNSPAVILAMDEFLWSLAEAELSVFSEAAKKNLEELRISVSRSLRYLSAALPEISSPENGDDEQDDNNE